MTSAGQKDMTRAGQKDRTSAREKYWTIQDRKNKTSATQKDWGIPLYKLLAKDRSTLHYRHSVATCNAMIAWFWLTL